MKKFLRLVLNDHQSTLDEMLDTLNEKTIHQQCIDSLLTKVYKLLNGFVYRANQLWETLPQKLMLTRIIQERIKKLAFH